VTDPFYQSDYDKSPEPDAWDPFAAAVILILLVALAASLIPAGRAINVDPMRALRNE
jgi:ABC-type lipoprotein release transport system permease subunit